MPFTPFHMGAAVLLKPMVPVRFSVLVFGVSQVAIDIGPLVVSTLIGRRTSRTSGGT